ncbi:MAG: ankyrin repeat domain-containing protein [Vicinamibacterales bacterium]
MSMALAAWVIVAGPMMWPSPLADRVPAQAATGANQPDADGLTPLMKAAARGSAADVASLITDGADVNLATRDQRVTPLMFAAYFGHEAIVRALIDKGARLEVKDAQGAAAVDWAALGDHAELEPILSGPGAALNPFLNTGLMPIWLMDKAAEPR